MTESTGVAREQTGAGDAIFARVKVEVRLVWTGVEELPALTANQFLAQIDQVGDQPDLLLLTLGQASPPVATGTAEEQTKALVGMSEIHVKPLAKYAISPARLRELIALLQRVDSVVFAPADGAQA